MWHGSSAMLAIIRADASLFHTCFALYPRPFIHHRSSCRRWRSSSTT